MRATKEQKFKIRKNCGFDIGVKEELVQWATGKNDKTSLNDLSYEQANQILLAQGDRDTSTANWALFDKANSKHLYILSLLIQHRIVKEVRGRDVADLEKLSTWLKSDKSPVRKPLKQMNAMELSKIIHALEQMVKKKWK